MRIKLLLIFLFFTISLKAQPDYGIKIGLHFVWGQPVCRMGLQSGFFISQGVFQFQCIHHIFYAFKNYGPHIPRWESQLSPGIQIGFGNSRIRFPSFIFFQENTNFTSRRNSVGYSIKYYLDQIGTSQTCASFHLRLSRFWLSMENDGFVFKAWDRYRTGAWAIGYDFYNSHASVFHEHSIRLGNLLYTGYTQDTSARWIHDNYPARFGYKDLRKARYGNCSHGILSLRYAASLVQYQHVYAEIGIDHEKIRNLFQNKIIHDMSFIPGNWIKVQNPHIPMLQENGEPYLFGENQKIKKGKAVWEVGINGILFY